MNPRLFQISQKRHDPALPVRLTAIDFFPHAKPTDALQGNQQATIARFGKGCDTAKTADTAQLRTKAFIQLIDCFVIIAVDFRLDHADDAFTRQGILDHRQIARLENIERKLATGQKQRPFNGKTGTVSGISAPVL